VSTFNLTSPAKTLHHLAVLAIFDSLVWLLTYSACACVYMHVNVLFINLSSYIIYMSVFMLLTYCYGLYMIYLPHDHVFDVPILGLCLNKLLLFGISIWHYVMFFLLFIGRYNQAINMQLIT
jgi:hypothetical protein